MKHVLEQKPDKKVADELIKKFQQAGEDLQTALVKTGKQKEEISKATKAYIDTEVEKILKSINIEEINRGELSVRVSLLKKAGFTSYFSIYKAHSTTKLANINGIGENTAYQIRKIVYEDAKKIRESIVPRFNAEDTNAKSNALLKALYVYIYSQEHIKNGQEILRKDYSYINKNIEQTKLLTNSFKWAFSSKKSKILAVESYLNLKEIESSTYFLDISFIIDSLVQINNEKISKIWKDFAQNSAKYYATLEQLEGFSINDHSKDGMSSSLIEEIENLEADFTGLKCTLRSYQEFGTKYILNQGYVLLGDEMGLGKTVQAIASMVAIRNYGENRFLVVCPASVLINWCREIAQHSDLIVYKLHGEDRDIMLQEWLKYGGVAVTTYETMDKLDFSQIFNISLLVADEAHYSKNPKAKRSINLGKMCDKANRVLFMTGTALENKVDEMCYLISCLDKNIALEIENMKHLTQAPMFREKVAPVYLRRTREDVLKELPDLIEKEEWCEMGEEEKKAYYSSTMDENFMAMRQVSWQVSNVNNSSKANRLMEIYTKAKEEKRKVIVFSYFLNTIKQVQNLLGDVCYGPINGSVPPQERQKIIDEFSRAEDGSVLLAQIQAGGTGVNIQAASCVILCEPQLKPSTENQAISRTYRMGQTRNVLVHKLLCEDSVDERIVEILNSKEQVFNNFADISVVGKQSVEIDKQASKNIVACEKERLKQQSNI